MSTPSFLPDAASIALAPYLDREILREDVRRRHYEAEASRSSGVRFGGMEPGSYQPRSDAQILADAETKRRVAEVFAATPRGHFLRAVAKLEAQGVDGAERLRALYCRELADDRQPVNAKAIGAALTILNKIPGQAARNAIDALSELLLQADRRAA